MNIDYIQSGKYVTIRTVCYFSLVLPFIFHLESL